MSKITFKGVGNNAFKTREAPTSTAQRSTSDENHSWEQAPKSAGLLKSEREHSVNTGVSGDAMRAGEVHQGGPRLRKSEGSRH
jgi:hypothetical protein